MTAIKNSRVSDFRNGAINWHLAYFESLHWNSNTIPGYYPWKNRFIWLT